MPPPDAREILENPRIAAEQSDAILNLSESRPTVGHDSQTQPFTRSHDHGRSHDHAQTHHFRDTRSIRDICLDRNLFGPKTKPFVATQGRQTIIKTTTNLLSFDWMGLEAGQQCAFTGFTVTYLNQPPCCRPFFTFAESNHKKQPIPFAFFTIR